MNPARSRHCDRVRTTRITSSRKSDTCCEGGADALRGESDSAPLWGATRFDQAWSGRGVADLLSTILRVVIIGRTERNPYVRTFDATPQAGLAIPT